MTGSPAPPGGVVVANPGTVPEVIAAVGGLARAGILDRYYVPLVAGPRFDALARALPPRLGHALARELRRRQVPGDVAPSAVRMITATSHLACVAMARSPVLPSARLPVYRSHARLFDGAVGRRLTRNDRAVLTVASAALTTLTTARRMGVASLLDCPIAHHRVAAALLQEEARLVPAFAGTLQLHNTPEAVAKRLDAEIRLADRVLTLSRFETETFLTAGVDQDKIVEIPPGVDTTLFRPGRRPSDDVFRVLFVGQVTQRKGISYLLDAFRLAGLRDAELVLVGALQGRRPWVGHHSVHHLPAVPRSELPDRYAQADVFVMPSLIEGSCLTALEAMACGLPVIVSENAGTSDLIEDGREGYVVPIRDAGAIADRLRALEADPDLRERMARAARTRAEALGWEVYAARVTATIQDLC